MVKSCKLYASFKINIIWRRCRHQQTKKLESDREKNWKMQSEAAIQGRRWLFQVGGRRDKSIDLQAEEDIVEYCLPTCVHGDSPGPCESNAAGRSKHHRQMMQCLELRHKTDDGDDVNSMMAVIDTWRISVVCMHAYAHPLCACEP